MLWTNEISRDLSLRWVSDGYAMLHNTPAESLCPQIYRNTVISGYSANCITMTSQHKSDVMVSQITNKLPCLFYRMFMGTTRQTSKLRVAGLCEGNPPVTGGIASQTASNAENVFMSWCHYGKCTKFFFLNSDGYQDFTYPSANWWRHL